MDKICVEGWGANRNIIFPSGFIHFLNLFFLITLTPCCALLLCFNGTDWRLVINPLHAAHSRLVYHADMPPRCVKCTRAAWGVYADPPLSCLHSHRWGSFISVLIELTWGGVRGWGEKVWVKTSYWGSSSWKGSSTFTGGQTAFRIWFKPRYSCQTFCSFMSVATVTFSFVGAACEGSHITLRWRCGETLQRAHTMCKRLVESSRRSFFSLFDDTAQSVMHYYI